MDSPPVFKLRDGRRVVVRAIRVSDREHVDEGLRRLSPHTRRLRFHGERERFTDTELSYLVECDGLDRIATVAVGLDAQEEEEIGIGVARAYRDSARPDTAEIAVVVVDDWQRQGVGRLLLDALARRCIEVGIRRWTAQVLGENQITVDLLTAFGSISGRRWERGVQEITIELD